MQIILLLDDFLTNKNRESLFTILICIVGNFPIWRFFWKKKHRESLFTLSEPMQISL